MSQGDTPITMIGNVVADPELRYTPAGVAVTSFRLASTPRVFNKGSGQWEDGEPLFLTCNVWRDMAENTMDTIHKGMRVIVWGRLSQSRWTSKTGEKRTAHEIDVDDLGPSIKFGPATVTSRRAHQSGGHTPNGPSAGPYAATAQTTPPAGGGFGQPDEAPF